MGQKKKKKVVRFSTVNIREYNVCLGDNPSVARGAPISLDWQYGEEISHVFGDYEQQQQQQQAPERTTTEFKRTSLERIQLLKQIGYSRKEIQNATHRVQKIRQQRFQTRRHYQRMKSLRSFFFDLPVQKKATTTTVDVVSAATATSVRLLQ